MKNWLKMMALSLVTMTFCGCGDEEPVVSPYLEVTPNNLAGEWMLQTWMNEPLAEGIFVYLDLERKDCLYTMYQNIDSFSPRLRTGHYNILVDPWIGSIIRGNYDYDEGEWTNRYIITALTKDSMLWTAQNDPTDVSLYVRTEIPAEIRAAYPSDEE